MKKKTTESLVMSYAQNRMNLREVQGDISGFGFCPETQTWDLLAQESLESARKEYFSEDDCGSSGWPGWVQLLKDTESFHNPHKPETYELARLLDLRRRINREAGKIKRAIAARGRALLRF